MSWTYSPDQINSAAPKSTLYQVRQKIGDIVSTRQQLQDEDIAAILTMHSTVIGAAAECCRMLATMFSSSVDVGAGDTRISFSQMAKAYSLRAAQLESDLAASGAGAPYCASISVTGKQNQEANLDRVPANFTIGMMDNSLPVPSVGVETEDETSQVGLGPGP